MQRETKSIQTPGGATIEFYAYLTGKEARKLQDIFFRKAKLVGEKFDKFDGFEASAVTEAEEYVLRTLLVSVNGNKEGAFEALDNMPQSEYMAVLKAVNEVTGKVSSPDFLGQSSTSTRSS